MPHKASNTKRTKDIDLDRQRYCRFMGHSAITGLRHYSVVDPDDLHTDLLAGLDAAGSERRRSGSARRCVYFV